MEVNKKIKTMHELIKTVMNLHQEDFSCFEKSSNNKVTIAKNFSFDMTRTVKEINNDKDSAHDSSSEEKDKIIIKEPLEVFEIENQAASLNEFSSDEKNSSKANDSQDDKILKLHNSADFNQQSKKQESQRKVLMSPKFKSFEERQDVDKTHHNLLNSDYGESSDLGIKKKLDNSNESSNQRDIRSKNNTSKLGSSKFKNSPSDKELDYKEQLRKSLETGSKNKQSPKGYKNEFSEKNMLSPNESDIENGSIQKHEYLMSPLNENYKDIEEFTQNYKRKQQEMLEEFNSMHQDTFNLVHQFDRFTKEVDVENSDDD